MLELRAIRKAYTTASLTQVALNDVSVAFRDNEFVAVLGQSGSGKTTMLNVIGGLDRFDSGDLIIDGISTRKYKARDWDTYRNNRIGFVFQAYNLISHQSILSNVELALTLSGVSRSERKQRALAALAEVGLADHVHKKPNQLSGGQMQRVAIARALVNDPEILLADEPTGALDSETSIQVMDLLKEVAKDRLVIMVTHNPELAHQYATRIVELADGKVIGDSDPFTPTPEHIRTSKDARRAKMGFLTALSLSFSNLMTKKGRTLMTAFAGSIGIIGIAAILSLANGVNDYIARSEEELLTSYPLTIDKVGFDFASLIDSQGEQTQSDENITDADSAPSGFVTTKPTINDGLGKVNSNDLKSLRTFIQQDGRIQKHSQAIDYTYRVEPLIYLPMDNPTVKDKPIQAHPSSIFSGVGLTENISLDILENANTNSFRSLPGSNKIYIDSVELLEGTFPSNPHDLLLVLPSNGELPDVMEMNLGLRDRSEVEKIIKDRTKNARSGLTGTGSTAKKADEKQSTYTPDPARQYSYTDFIGLEYRHVNSADRYVWDEELKVWVDKSEDQAHMKKLINKGEKLTIVGVVKNSSDKDVPVLPPGIYYSKALISDMMTNAADSKIVRDQMSRPEINIFTGRRFDEQQSGNGLDSFDMSNLMKINEDKIAQAFGGGAEGLGDNLAAALGNLDLSGMDLSALNLGTLDFAALDLSNIDLSGLDLSSIQMPPIDPSKIDISALNIEEILTRYPSLSQEHINSITTQVLADNPGADPTTFAQALVEALSQDPTISQEGGALLSELSGTLFQEVLKQVGPQLAQNVGAALKDQLGAALGAQMQAASAQIMEQVGSTLQNTIGAQLEQAAASLQGALNGFAIDETALAEAFEFTSNAEDLSALFSSLMKGGQDTYENNLKKLGYGDLNDPDSINIYPSSFQDKEDIKGILDDYNAEKEAAGQKEQVVTYSDLVGALMSQVTTIVNMVSAMLIAFVAISLVVSSIMIGIITYISVLERKKEIGILRSIGASKRDIRHVFNAETILIGFLAGVIGIGATIAMIIPANAIIESQFNVTQLVVLPPLAAVILVAISMFLTWIAGLMPANKAAKADPVEALRSE